MAAAGGIAVVALGGLASTASAGSSNASKLVADYADATWTPQTLTVRIAPGVEVRNGVTTKFIEASINGSACVRADGGSYLATAHLDAKESGKLSGVRVDARDGEAEVDRRQQFTGSLTLQHYSDRSCSVTDGAMATLTNPKLQLDAEWKRKAGSTPVVYSGADCGGTGTCYYVDAVAKGTVSLPGMGDDAKYDLGRSDSGFLFNGQYPL